MKALPVWFLLAIAAAAAVTAVVVRRQLPPVLPGGDVARGEVVFARYHCGNCHSLRGQPAPATPPQTLKIQLGGDPGGRDGLARSILDPNHAIHEDWKRIVEAGGGTVANSPMIDLYAEYSRKMSVGELVDLATFLEAQ
jgi:hypothetical protein